MENSQRRVKYVCKVGCKTPRQLQYVAKHENSHWREDDFTNKTIYFTFE